MFSTVCVSIYVATITAAKTGDEVEAVYQKAVADMAAVKITYLFYEQAKLISNAGLPQGSKLFVQRMNDIAALTACLHTVKANITPAVRKKALQKLYDWFVDIDYSKVQEYDEEVREG
jgi:hypothetical protein